MLFSCKLWKSNCIISLAIWCNKHSQIFQRLKIAHALWVCAVFLSLKNLFVLINIKLHWESCYCLHNKPKLGKKTAFSIAKCWKTADYGGLVEPSRLQFVWCDMTGGSGLKKALPHIVLLGWIHYEPFHKSLTGVYFNYFCWTLQNWRRKIDERKWIAVIHRSGVIYPQPSSTLR